MSEPFKYNYPISREERLEVLVDACYEAMELYKAESSYQKLWKKNWLREARELVPQNNP